MFISTKEKNLMLHRIASLELSVQGLYTTIRFLEEKLHKPKPKPKTEAQKAKQAEYMRKYTARKRAEKKALA
jgi:hypothetical protein